MPQHARLMRLATRAALATALLLALAKAVAWWLSGSVSLLAGLTDSLLDGAASLLNLIAVHYALRPADEDHRYGHGKAEALAGLAQALFVGASAVLVAVLAMTVALLLFQRHVVRVTGSTAVRADSLHYRSDLLLNSGILLALVLAGFGWQRLDPLFGLGIAAYILWSAVSIVREAVAVLMDEELAPELSERMHLLASGVPGVLGTSDLRTRISGTHWFVQLHVELPGDLSLQQSHSLCKQVEDAIRSEFPRAQVLAYATPSAPAA